MRNPLDVGIYPCIDAFCDTTFEFKVGFKWLFVGGENGANFDSSSGAAGTSLCKEYMKLKCRRCDITGFFISEARSVGLFKTLRLVSKFCTFVCFWHLLQVSRNE